MCLGPAVQPATEKARTYVTIIRVLMVVQAIVVILNFVAVSQFLQQAIFGIFFFFILFMIQRQISYQMIMIFIFISIFFAVDFMTYFLVPIQQGSNLTTYSGMQMFIFADSIFSFLYYCFCMVFCFYPYKEFKAIAYNQNPALRNYFQHQDRLVRQEQTKGNDNRVKADYKVDYGNITYDQHKRNNDNGTFEVFKGKGVVIG